MTKPEKRNYRIIGLTGGIGSGKSAAARRFAELGAAVYQADDISRQALKPSAHCYREVVETFGNDILASDGQIDRKKLASIVFSDEQKRAKLNGIVHPYVIDQLFSRAKNDLGNQKHAIAIFEVPLLFESGLDENMDRNIVVSSEEDMRVRRVVARDGVSREQALARIRAQMPEEEKRKRADYILENNGSLDDLVRQVDALYRLLNAEEPRV